MLGAEAEPDDASRYAGERGKPPHQAQEEGWFQTVRLAKHAFDDVVLNLHLKPLGTPRGHLAPFLNTRQILCCHLTGTERIREDVCGCDRILDRKVDPDAADRRHGVGCVADAEKAGPIPLRETVDADGQELDAVEARRSLQCGP